MLIWGKLQAGKQCLECGLEAEHCLAVNIVLDFTETNQNGNCIQIMTIRLPQWLIVTLQRVCVCVGGGGVLLFGHYFLKLDIISF